MSATLTVLYAFATACVHGPYVGVGFKQGGIDAWIVLLLFLELRMWAPPPLVSPHRPLCHGRCARPAFDRGNMRYVCHHILWLRVHAPILRRKEGVKRTNRVCVAAFTLYEFCVERKRRGKGGDCSWAGQWGSGERDRMNEVEWRHSLFIH